MPLSWTPKTHSSPLLMGRDPDLRPSRTKLEGITEADSGNTCPSSPDDGGQWIHLNARVPLLDHCLQIMEGALHHLAAVERSKSPFPRFLSVQSPAPHQ